MGPTFLKNQPLRVQWQPIVCTGLTNHHFKMNLLVNSRNNSRNNINIDRRSIADYDRVIAPNLRRIKQNNLIGIYSTQKNYSRNNNQIRSIPNLSAIKNDVIKNTYQKIRFSNRNQRGNIFSRGSNYSDYNYSRNSANSGNFNSRSQMSRGSNYSAPRSTGRSGSFSSGSSSRSSSGASKSSAPSSGAGRNINSWLLGQF